MDYHQLLAYAEREEAREAKRTAAAGVSVMRAELDAATSTSADLQEASVACVCGGGQRHSVRIFL